MTWTGEARLLGPAMCPARRAARRMAAPFGAARTGPLVGLGQRTRYLHDGRAATLRDAIMAHGGEGEIVRNRFFALGEAEREAVVRFLGGV